jgi:UDP:flavonoid glycosyltransferase YjiC (YdhE family)
VIAQDNACAFPALPASGRPWVRIMSCNPLELGSADVALMCELVAILAETPHRYVVSRGPRHRECALAPNMLGAEFLPQPSVFAHVDAVVTHGGNNTVTECLWFGVPMVVLPIFWDQHDNAQRVHECGYGVRVATDTRTAHELTEAVDRVLTDEAMRARARAARRRLRERPGTELGADLIERVARTGAPIRT